MSLRQVRSRPCTGSVNGSKKGERAAQSGALHAPFHSRFSLQGVSAVCWIFELAVNRIVKLLVFHTTNNRKDSRAHHEARTACGSAAQARPSVSCFRLRPAARRGCRTGPDGRAHRNRQRCSGRSDFRSRRSPRLASHDRRVDDADDERQRATALPVSYSGTVRAGHQHAGVCALT